ncbi:hypothetical protein ACTA71_005404 [Dictyostelium dimigraforme]
MAFTPGQLQKPPPLQQLQQQHHRHQQQKHYHHCHLTLSLQKYYHHHHHQQQHYKKFKKCSEDDNNENKNNNDVNNNSNNNNLNTLYDFIDIESLELIKNQFLSELLGLNEICDKSKQICKSTNESNLDMENKTTAATPSTTTTATRF